MSHIQRIKAEHHAQQKFTVLESKSGEWPEDATGKLYATLDVEVSRKLHRPQFIIIFGHFDKKVIENILDHSNFTLKHRTGVSDKDMPFVP